MDIGTEEQIIEIEPVREPTTKPAVAPDRDPVPA